nr:uncharacterized protein LOC109162867 isoform X1 [Ipomoea batatas]
MERTPAASAMQWSIELEKGLRSKQPGKSSEAILQIGPRLEWWSREPNLAVAEYKMFGLIPGEDKLFADTILLRLAEAFKSGDKLTRMCIVKIFMSELRQSRRWGCQDRKDNRGIISKDKLDSYVELLTRVKSVFDTGDAEERALALVLFGCWAGFAKENADIQYIILSSLVSNNILEVKASLFAAGCFCELADDFAPVLLEMFENLMSPETSKTLRLAAGRAFAKMWFPILLADRAYKIGLKLMLESPEEEFSKVMLISLSKISSKWTSLIPVQVDLLISFISKERASCLQATALKCLNFILSRGVFPFPESADTIQKFLNVLNESKFSPDLQCVALKILYKVLLYNLHKTPHVEVLNIFSRFIAIVQFISESPIIPERLLAIRVLADISDKLVGRAEDASVQIGSTVATQVISFAMDRSTYLVMSNKDIHQPNSMLEQEIKCLFGLLLNLFEKNQELGALILDKICIFIRDLVNMLNGITTKPIVCKNIDNFIEPDQENFMEIQAGQSVVVESMICARKVILNCFQNQGNLNSVSPQVFDTVKLLVKHVCGCRSFHIYIRVIYNILLHSCMEYRCMWHELGKIMNSTRDFSLCYGSVSWDRSFEYETSAIEYVNIILGRNENWLSYKIGKYATCQGAWLTANLIFEQLRKIVQSEVCCSWLESLAQFSRMERQFQLFNFDLSEVTTGKSSIGCYIETTLGACNDLRSSVCRLDASTSGLAFCFQRWFLTLRVKVIEAILDSIKLVIAYSSVQGGARNNECLETSLMHSLGQVSYRMKSLVQEFDLFAASFIGIDGKSRIMISTLALSCSLLAFTTGFTFLFANLHASEDISGQVVKPLDGQLYAMLSHDLFGRLWHIDNETSKKLWLLSKFLQTSGNTLLPQFRNQISNSGCEAIAVAKLCRYAVTIIHNLQNEVTGSHDHNIKSRILSDTSKLLFNVLSLWIRIPFRAPKHFFQLRPCVGSELFLMGEDGEKLDSLFVTSGFLLRVNLCLQLKNLSSSLPVGFSKFYCVLHSRPSYRISNRNREDKQRKPLSSQEEVDNLIYLNRKLLEHTSGSSDCSSMHSIDKTTGVLAADSFVCFEPNEKAQGFSTCLLDVSSFPVGCYEIKWHSCGVDNEGSYWSFIPLNGRVVFTVKEGSL